MFHIYGISVKSPHKIDNIHTSKAVSYDFRVLKDHTEAIVSAKRIHGLLFNIQAKHQMVQC